MNKKRDRWKAASAVFCIVFLLGAVAAGAAWVERKTTARAGEAESGESEASEEEELDGFDEDISYVTLYDKDYVYDHDIESYLVIGTDGSGDEEGEAYQGSMADFLALLVLDKTEKSYAVLQINRDTVTEIYMLDENDDIAQVEQMQVCTAHWYGSSKEVSCENTVDAVMGLLGEVDITGYYALPMDQVPKLNHTVGGVEVTVEDDFSGVDDSLVQGESILLNDEQAYTFVRARMAIGDGENASRMRRQKQYLEAFAAKARKESADNPQLAASIYEEFEDIATTDIEGNQVSKLANSLMTYENKGIYEFEGVTADGRTYGDEKDYAIFTPDEASVIGVMTELYSLREDE